MPVVIAAYDIGNDLRRRRVVRCLEAYGHRVQESVFQLQLDADDMTALRRQLGALLAKTDLFDLFPLDGRRPEYRVRWQRPVPASRGFFSPSD